ncbi:MAG: phospholipase D-like domain-containing protein [Pirellulales bacterium]
MEFASFLVEKFWEFWPHLLSGTYVVLMVVTSAHVVLYKKDTRAAIGWIGVVVMVPIMGALLYGLLGINRLQRRASNLRGGLALGALAAPRHVADRQTVLRVLPETRHLVSLERLVGELTGRPLLYGNRIAPLVNGEQAYPEMIEAIDKARDSVGLTTYIFDNDRAGAMFADALERAVERGVDVRVIIDAVGARYTFPSIVGRLRKSGVTVARFLPTLMPGRFAYANLRSHRKILVIDGRIGFTGGLNIREGHDARFKPKDPILDHHFRIEGPVVAQLQEVFAEDWAFCTEEVLDGEKWFPPLDAAGDALARGISAGPDGDLDKRRLTLEGALASAESSVCILTPYFLPEAPLITSLNVAALRGIEVDIILPEANNLTLVKWASTALLWQVLQRGCRVWLSPPPFDHTKLMVVDRTWVLLGSGNWDPRSLRLNFEFDVEVYDRELAATVHKLCLGRRDRAKRVTLADVDGRSMPIRLRDGVARLLTPYL